MMKKIILFLLCALCMTSISAYAETLIDFDFNTLTISSQGNTKSDMMKSFASFVIIPYGMNTEDTEIKENTLNNVFYKTVEADKDGEYSVKFSLPDSMDNGQYCVISYDFSGENINRIGLINGDFSEDLSSINDAKSSSEIKEALNNLTSYNLDETILSKYGEDISAHLYNSRPNSGYTNESFVKAYNIGEGLARFNLSDISLDGLLREYCVYTDVNYTTNYAELSETGKTEVETLFRKSAQSIKDDFAKVYDECFEIAEIKGSRTADELKTNYVKSANARGRSLLDYNNLSSYKKDSVFLNMLSLISKKNSLSEIDALFDECVSGQKTANNTSVGANNGGGAGGAGTSIANKGSSGMGNSIPLIAETNTSVEKKYFMDTEGHWAENFIRELYEKGVINGFDDGNFYPNNPITRAEFIKMVCTAFNINGETETSFKDVSSNDWFYNYVCCAEKKGLITGSDEGNFEPYRYITREDVAIIIQRFLNLEISTETVFSDSDKIADYAVDAINALAGKGIITGYDDNTINPKGEITRAEISAVITRTIHVG